MFVFKKPLFTITMAPKHMSSDTDSASKPKRSHDVLSNSEKEKILDMIWGGGLYAEIARLYGKNKFSVREVMRNKEKICVSFSVAPPTTKVTATAHDKVLM
jgi:hypothetical protein